MTLDELREIWEHDKGQEFFIDSPDTIRFRIDHIWNDEVETTMLLDGRHKAKASDGHVRLCEGARWFIFEKARNEDLTYTYHDIRPMTSLADAFESLSETL